MTEAYNDALAEQLEANVWTRLADEARSMSGIEYAQISADIVGIFDPTPASDAVGAVLSAAQGDILGVGLSLLGMVPYVGDLGKMGKIARLAPRTARALEALLRNSDNLARLGARQLSELFSLRQVADARRAAADRVRQAMLDARNRTPNCRDCAKLDDVDGTQRRLQMPRSGNNGRWDTPDGLAPTTGTGRFNFNDPKVLPDGRTVDGIDFVNGEPDFSSYAFDNQAYNLWEVSGDVATDERALRNLMGDGWSPPNTVNSPDGYVLHHGSDGRIMYVPRVLHDRGMGGVAHTGGNAITNNRLF